MGNAAVVFVCTRGIIIGARGVGRNKADVGSRNGGTQEWDGTNIRVGTVGNHLFIHGVI